MKDYSNEIQALQDSNGDIAKFAKWYKDTEGDDITYGKLFELFRDILVELNRNNSEVLISLFDNLEFRDHMSKYIPGEDKPSYKYDELLRAMAKTITESKK